MLSVICFNLDQSKILLSGNGFRYIQTQEICPHPYYNYRINNSVIAVGGKP